MEGLDPAIVARVASGAALGGLALFFGRTLRAGEVPLIERIARISDPSIPPHLSRYTRRLTVVWCAYLAAASLLTLSAIMPVTWSSALVWSGTVVLFVGEHWVRPYFFPGRTFPGLMQQLRDTVAIWHVRL